MTNSAVGKALFLSLAMLVVSGTSCFKGDLDIGDESAHVGGIGLKLSVTPGVTVSFVNYTISGNGFSKTGSIDVSGGGSTFTKQVDGIPPGNGYKIALTATASDGSTGSGEATFNVVARQVTSVSVVLRFIPSAPATGSILINGSVNVCPLVSAISAQPPAVAVGGTTTLTSTASDPDSQPSALTYKWTVTPASAGTLSSATIANPVFTAGAVGTAKLTLLVSDGDAPCETDPASLNALSIDVVVSSGGAAGSSGGGAGGSGASGGAGGSGASGGAGGSGGTGGSGGSGGTGGSGGGNLAACTACESVSHPDPGDQSDNAGCPTALNRGKDLTGNTVALAGIPEATGQSKAAAFQQILDCFHSTGCAEVTDTDCFCGIGVDSNVCFAGTFEAATGPCKNLVAVGAETTVAAEISNRFFDTTYAIGNATTVIETCDIIWCAAECL